jgi:hypothetical protein
MVPGFAGNLAAAAGRNFMSKSTKRRKKMFISVLPGEQVEVAVAEDGS